MKTMKAYAELVARLTEIRNFGSIGALMGWDQETFMPEQGAAARSELNSLLAGHSYGLLTGKDMVRVVRGLSADGGGLSPECRVVVRETRRSLDRALRLTRAHVTERARLDTMTQQVWTRARRRSDFALVRPWLEKVVALKRRECDLLGYKHHPYDALLETYEPYCTTREIDPLFSSLRGPLVALVRTRGDGVGRAGSGDFAARSRREKEAQAGILRDLLQRMGFDFSRGRVDRSAHPFATQIHPTDVRITTRAENEGLLSSISSILHEGGHALYEQGLDPRHWGTPLCETVSLGIHESQSRLWENQVGRSEAFWKHLLPRVRKAWPGRIANVPVEKFCRRMNRIRPVPLRLESDEVTYNLHIILRYELEKHLIEGAVRVRDLPGEWRARMKSLLGVAPKNDAEGCLQDVHWYCGSIGYFPTYTLGNLYAAQFYRAFAAGHPRWEKELASGRFEALTRWLRKEIHQPGCRYTAAELVRRVTGEKLDAKYFLEYLNGKYGAR